MEAKVLVMGTMRAGTKYMSRVLRAAGLDVGHEYSGKDGTVSNYFAVDDDLYPTYPKLSPAGRKMHTGERRRDFDYAVRFHQIRHPLKVVPSAVKIISKNDWRWISRHVPIHPSLPPYIRAMEYWMRWNRLCAEQKADFTYHVEDIESVWPEIAGLLNLGNAPLPDINKTTNRSHGFRSAEVVTWEDLERKDALVTKRLRKAAAEFGYE